MERASEQGNPGGLAAPSVNPAEYDRDYYLHTAMGADDWRESAGREVAGIYEAALTMAGMKAGDAVLDIGCGRGELVRIALELGASRAAGIDYSPHAIEIGRQTLAASSSGAAAELACGDARALPYEDEAFDLVTMLDVVEHMAPTELAAGLAEAYRVLKPDGRLFAHTAPNRLVYDLTYRAQRWLLPWRIRRWPADPRNEYERLMHVNEQSRRSLGRSLAAAGFVDVSAWTGRWFYRGHLTSQRAGRWYHRLGRIPGLRDLVAMDLFAAARRPG